MSEWKLQYAIGDQGENRKIFDKSYFKICPIVTCKGNKISVFKDACGCRMNGDAYGTDVFTCNTCGWKTSFFWDDSSEVYYYETKHWN